MTVEVDSTVTLTITTSEVTATTTTTSKITHTSMITSELGTTYTVPVTDDVSAVVEVSGNNWGVVSTIQELSWKSVTGKTSVYLGIANAAVCDWNEDSDMVTCEGTTFSSRLSTSDYPSAATTSTTSSRQPPTATDTGWVPSHADSSGISNAGLAGAISGSSIFVFAAIALGFIIIRRHRKRRDALSAPYPEHTTESTAEGADIDNTMPQGTELPGQGNHIGTEKMPSDHTISDHISPIDGPGLEARHYQPYAELDDTIARHELYDHAHTELSTERPQYELDARQNMRPSEKELWFHT